MGAYYTKEDITGYISKNTVIPFLFDAAKEKCKIAFDVGADLCVCPASEDGQSHKGQPQRVAPTVWRLLQTEPDRYFYPAVKKGIELPLPDEIAAGIADVSKRTEWNRPAPSEYALPTEIWREVVARRQRYEDIKSKMLNGEVQSINDLITYNLDIRQFAQDVIWNSEGPELLRAFYHAIEKVTVLDPTCGSGAFLFAALNILEPLYEACLDRMQVFVNELDVEGADLCVCPDTDSIKGEHTGSPLQKKYRSDKYGDFKKILKRVEEHPNLKYFIFKSIIVNNLYGGDIMEEAIEICKLRLFLKLVAQIDSVERIEPLPDIDFNIRAGNTLVGFATLDEIKKSMEGDWVSLESLPAIQEKAEDVDRLFKLFQKQQTELGGEVTPEDKQELRRKLAILEDELNQYLASEYGINPSPRHSRENGNPDRHWIPGQARNDKKSDGNGKYQQWLDSHKPFHWFIEFYGILKSGGFDVIIGNPPYVEYGKVRSEYSIKGYETESCGNLYSFVIERSLSLINWKGRFGMIVPISLVAAQRMSILQKYIIDNSASLYLANFGLRPAALFQGVMQRLSIVLLEKGQNSKVYSTDYKTWYSEERAVLFSKIKYLEITQLIQDYCIPKVDSIIAASILQKMFLIKEKDASAFLPGRSLLYYHNAGGYWIKAFDFKPTYETTLKEDKKHTTISILHVRDEIIKVKVLAVLNSSLFYFFWKSLTDARHIYPSDIAMFRIKWYFDNIYVKEIQRLISILMNNLNSNSTVIKYGKATVQQFYVSKSKPIIDNIDHVLAKHYGFTDEELDFIINYDIKYRMRRESEEGV